MKYTCIKYSIRKSVRFRKWSRKAYGAFSSMCYQVSIGHVNKWIADSALSKKECNGNSLSDRCEGVSLCNNDEEHGDVMPDFAGFNVLVQKLVPVITAPDYNPERLYIIFYEFIGRHSVGRTNVL